MCISLEHKINTELKLSDHLPIVLFENQKVMREEFKGFFIIKQRKKPLCSVRCIALKKQLEKSGRNTRPTSRVSPTASVVL